jgi:hypothetical protein
LRSPRRPSFELLEDRSVPATWGNPWPDGSNLTLSFAPDGTTVGDRVSALFQALNAAAPTAAWQREILRAFQTWAVQANINIGLVADDGSPFGSPGRPQGDDRFGDIRLGGYAMSPEVMALASPFDAAAGTWAGDVKLNTSYLFGMAGKGEIDLFTALLHEAGHVFGLDHNHEDPNSALAERYHGAVSGLTPSDIVHIRELYGARSADRFDAAWSNGSRSAASGLSLLKHGDGSLGIRIAADVTSHKDVDFYKFTMPLNATTAVVKLGTAGLSLLQGKITVYDGWGRVVGSATASMPGQDLVIPLKQLRLLSTYYVEVEGAAGDVFGIGSYQFQVQVVPLLSSLTSVINSTLQVVGEIADDLHTDDTMLTASLLPLRLGQTDARYDFAYNGAIRDSWDVDFYRLKAPTASDGQSNVMSVMVWGKENGGLIPKATVFDGAGNRVPAQILVNDNGVYNIQVLNARSGATYYVKVEAQGRDHNVGRYFLGVDFGAQAVALQTIAHESVTSTVTRGLFHVARPQLFHFVFTPQSSQAGASVTFAVVDRRGNVLAERTATAGATVTLNVVLKTGNYMLRFTTAAAPPPDLVVLLQGLVLDDPIGPQGEDTTYDPYSDGTYDDSYYDDDGSYSSTSEDEMIEQEKSWWESQEQTESGAGTEDPYSSYDSNSSSWSYSSSSSSTTSSSSSTTTYNSSYYGYYGY